MKKVRRRGLLDSPKKRFRVKCPYRCHEGWYANYEELAKHLYSDHGWTMGCPCGKTGAILPELGRTRFLHELIGKHIACCPDLMLHVAEAELLRTARERRGDA